MLAIAVPIAVLPKSNALISPTTTVAPSSLFSSAAVDVTAVEPIIIPVAVTVDLNIAAPSALPSRVSIVISAPPSVPLKIISESFAAASIVILPEDVVKVTAASPAVKSSAAADPPPASAKENTPLPFVTNACPFEPSEVGRLNAVPPEVSINLLPSEDTDSLVS